MRRALPVRLIDPVITEKVFQTLETKRQARNNLIILMRGYELNQADLARCLGINRGTVTRWVQGKRTPSLEVAIWLAEEVKSMPPTSPN